MSQRNLSSNPEENLFSTDQKYLFEKSYEEQIQAEKSKPVECLGMTFPNDEKRREYFLEKLREKLKDPEFRKIEGFPIGSDEDILALSDPPYYTACPNPFIADFIKNYGKSYDPNQLYSREPFAADVSEGKNDPIYTLHSYHTKVPYRAIMKYILHYTDPGDLVFDGFGGTGMTGIAANSCDNQRLVREVGFQNHGLRLAIISELSPIASFISGTLNTALVDETVIRHLEEVISSLEQKLGWVYETSRPKDGKRGQINYVVWSETYVCSNCSSELVYYRDAIEKKSVTLGSNLQCPTCKVITPKRKLERCFYSSFDPLIGAVVKQVKYVPTLIKYNVGSRRGEKNPDGHDEDVLAKVNRTAIECWFPSEKIPQAERYYKDGLHIINVTHTHHFYTRRNLLCAAHLWEALNNNLERMLFTSFCDRHIVRRNRWLKTGPTRPLNNTLYFPPLFAEVNVFNIAKRKIRDLRKALPLIQRSRRTVVSATQSSTKLAQLPNCSVDYIFTDPPFGWNITYSELNFLWESWLKIKTQDKEEVIVNNQAKKSINDYRELIYECFRENNRILKPGRWMTVEFHNSSNIV